MSEPNQEPTMEEILASIRRIISEDDAPAEAAEPPAQAAPDPAPEPEPEPIAFAPEPQPEPASPEPEEDDVLELTDKVREPAETHGDIDVFSREEPAPAPAPAPAWRAPAEEEPLIADRTADSAASAFSHLARAVSMPADGKSLEDVVREMLRPLLKAWLDEHLPEIVQASVDAEVARIARTRGR